MPLGCTAVNDRMYYAMESPIPDYTQLVTVVLHPMTLFLGYLLLKSKCGFNSERISQMEIHHAPNHNSDSWSPINPRW
jgi:hypothetical protein